MTIRIFAVLVTLSVLSLGSFKAHAIDNTVYHHAETHVEELSHADDSHGDGHSTAGLPQLDPSSYPSQIFWLVVVFSLLYLFFGRKVLPDISNTLESRQDHIQGDLDESEKLKEEAENIHNAYEDILDEARKRSSQLFMDIESDIQKKSQKEYDSFLERMDKEVQLTEAGLEKTRRDAQDEMDVVAAEIAALAAEKIIGVTTDLDRAKDVIKDLNNKAKAA